jgi:hypothetical protein
MDTEIRPSIERCFTITELTGPLHMSYGRVLQLIRTEPGVLCFTHGSPGRRRRVMYRIPASVVERIIRRSANRAA